MFAISGLVIIALFFGSTHFQALGEDSVSSVNLLTDYNDGTSVINDVNVPRGGFIQVLFATDPIYPNSGDQTSLEFDFVNKELDSIQQDVDYKVSINKGSNQVYGIPITHTAQGSVSIPLRFQNSGTYQIAVEVDGISFKPIPPETTTFTVTVSSLSKSSPSISKNSTAINLSSQNQNSTTISQATQATNCTNGICPVGSDAITSVSVNPHFGAVPLTTTITVQTTGAPEREVIWTFGDDSFGSTANTRTTHTYRSAGNITGYVEAVFTDGQDAFGSFTVTTFYFNGDNGQSIMPQLPSLPQQQPSVNAKSHPQQLPSPPTNITSQQTPSTNNTNPPPEIVGEVKGEGYSSSSISDSQLLQDLSLHGFHIPSWFKKTTKWLADGAITQQDFENALNYMRQHGIIK